MVAAIDSMLSQTMSTFETSTDRSLFRPSRTNYPGSKFGPKTRYDLPQRHKAYGNADEMDHILFSGTSLQPQTVFGTSGGAIGSSALVSARSPPNGASLNSELAMTTPRAVLSDAGRTMMLKTADRNLPDLPFVDDGSDVHGILVLGGKSSGKTSFVMSLLAAVTGTYPNTPEAKEMRKFMPAQGQSWSLPERDVRLPGGESRLMRLFLTDTPPCGTSSKDEQPMCVTVSPNCSQHYNALPSWMRITLRSGNIPHYSVLFIIDSTAAPLWEDSQRCRELARLIAVLKRNQYTIVLAVTKLLQVRETRLREAAFGAQHGGEVGKDPRSSYESFVSRYIERICACLQAKAYENNWTFSEPGSAEFPLINVSIFDVPTWTGSVDHKAWLTRKGTPELPNLRYAESQLTRTLHALSKRSHSTD